MAKYEVIRGRTKEVLGVVDGNYHELDRNKAKGTYLRKVKDGRKGMKESTILKHALGLTDGTKAHLIIKLWEDMKSEESRGIVTRALRRR